MPSFVPRSLVASSLAMMALRTGFVVLLIGLAAYLFLAQSLEASAWAQLEQYVAERSRAENQWFDFVANEEGLFRDAFVARYRALPGGDPRPEFERLFPRGPDGARRPRPALFTGMVGGAAAVPYRHLSGAIEPGVAETPELMRRHLLALDLLSAFGAAAVPPAGEAGLRFRRPIIDLFFNTPEGSGLIYLPGTRWEVDFAAGFRFAAQEYCRVALPATNPRRTIRWTGTYYDPGMRRWLVSGVTPIDMAGRHVGSVGADIALDRLIKGLQERKLPGTTNLLFRPDGRLIAHPDLVPAIEARQGDFRMDRDGDAALAGLYRQVLATKRLGVIEDQAHDRLIGIGRLETPGWYMVTLYPLKLLNDEASRLALVILALGAVSLLVEVAITWQVLRTQVAGPLRGFQAATAAVAAGELSPAAAADLPVGREDEIGGLARAFALMMARLREARDTLEDRVRDRTAQLEVANQRQLELDALKSNFVNAVTHELRTPLTAIQGYAEFLEDEIGGPLTADQQAFVREITAGSKRLERLLNDLLDFARMDAGTFSLRREPSDLGERAAEAVAALMPLAHAGGVKLEAHAPDGPLVAAMDAQRVGQVLVNLLGNAIKFSPRGGSVRVVTRRDGAWLRCEVADEGPGIAEEDRERLFHRFTQLEGGVRLGKGAGLGLSIAKALVEAHGGAIGVEDGPAGGAVFWFTLPA